MDGDLSRLPQHSEVVFSDPLQQEQDALRAARDMGVYIAERMQTAGARRLVVIFHGFTNQAAGVMGMMDSIYDRLYGADLLEGAFVLPVLWQAGEPMGWDLLHTPQAYYDALDRASDRRAMGAPSLVGRVLASVMENARGTEIELVSGSLGNAFVPTLWANNPDFVANRWIVLNGALDEECFRREPDYSMYMTDWFREQGYRVLK